MARFLKFSAKQQALLDKVMDTVNPAPRPKSYAQNIVFLELIPAMHKMLQAMISPEDLSDLGDWS